jgi:toxin YoeB
MQHDPKICKRIGDLFDDIRKHPFEGIGKPEPLKYNLQGCWSRRITDEHRMVYCVKDNTVLIMQLRGHYNG